MTSLCGHSDASQADDKEKHAESENRSPSSQAELSHYGISNPNQYIMPSQLGVGHAMAPSTYPYHDSYYRSIFAPYDGQSYPPQSYGRQPTVHLQLMGIQQAGVPLPSDAVEEPVFVNPKQYHGIMRRRQSRAKAESENKLLKSRKPYLHESRHLHALSRVRGCGGRFLKAKENENQSNEVTSRDESQTNLNLNNNTNNLAYSDSAS